MQNEICSIDQQLQSAVATQVAENREKLYPIFKTVLLCGRQNFALRGHREGKDSHHPGNFKALLDFRMDSGDMVLKNYLKTAHKNATLYI